MMLTSNEEFKWKVNWATILSNMIENNQTSGFQPDPIGKSGTKNGKFIGLNSFLS